MKYTVCYPAGHTRVIEFAGMPWTPGALVEFGTLEEIPVEVRDDSRFVVTETAIPAKRTKAAKKAAGPSPGDNDLTKLEE